MFSWEAWTDELMAELVSNRSLAPQYVFAQIQCKAPCTEQLPVLKAQLKLRKGGPVESLCSSNLGFSIRLSALNTGQWTMYVPYPLPPGPVGGGGMNNF